MPEGVIVGGWPSVIAAYGITAIVLGLYVWSLIHRSRDVARPTRRSAASGAKSDRKRSADATEEERNVD